MHRLNIILFTVILAAAGTAMGQENVDEKAKAKAHFPRR